VSSFAVACPRCGCPAPESEEPEALGISGPTSPAIRPAEERNWSEREASGPSASEVETRATAVVAFAAIGLGLSFLIPLPESDAAMIQMPLAGALAVGLAYVAMARLEQ
jgi:hypothetical protein